VFSGFVLLATDAHRVCQAWHVASEVQVLTPGIRRAKRIGEGARGVVVRRGLEEAQSKDAGRRTGTGSEVWYTRDERARDRKVLHLQGGVLYKSGV